MGTAREELMALLRGSLYRTIKNFGMFGQISISIKDVTPQRLSIGLSTRHPLDGASVALKVRNAVLNWLQDLLPVERFTAVYTNPTLGIAGEVHDLPYAAELPRAGQLRSAEILIEETAGPAREELRPRFRDAWQRFVDEEAQRRTVTLRAEHDGPDSRFLSARLDDNGALIIEGQDLGPKTAIVSGDGEYEWSRTILAEDLPRVLALLDAPPDADILDVLQKHWTRSQSHELERRIRESDIPSKVWTWSG